MVNPTLRRGSEAKKGRIILKSSEERIKKIRTLWMGLKFPYKGPLRRETKYFYVLGESKTSAELQDGDNEFCYANLKSTSLSPLEPFKKERHSQDHYF